MAKAKTSKRRSSAGTSSHSKINAGPVETKNVRESQVIAVAGPSGERMKESKSVGEELAKRDDSGSNPTTEAMSKKRKHDGDSETEKKSTKRRKRRKKDKALSNPAQSPRPTIRKLAPPRPFPTVPTSVSATGPRSAHTEGKNRICITRKTELGFYLRRCKDVVVKDGYKTLHLHAMGAAIPHLARLAVSLPSILPFPSSDVQTEVRTGTAEVQDEVIPDDEDEDITLRTRGKSTMSVIIKIEGGDNDERQSTPSTRKNEPKGKGKGKGKGKEGVSDDPGETSSSKRQPEQLVFAEADLEDDDE